MPDLPPSTSASAVKFGMLTAAVPSGNRNQVDTITHAGWTEEVGVRAGVPGFASPLAGTRPRSSGPSPRAIKRSFGFNRHPAHGLEREPGIHLALPASRGRCARDGRTGGLAVSRQTADDTLQTCSPSGMPISIWTLHGADCRITMRDCSAFAGLDAGVGGGRAVHGSRRCRQTGAVPGTAEARNRVDPLACDRRRR